MKTKKLKTGVQVTTNEKDEIISVSSPYCPDEKLEIKFGITPFLLFIAIGICLALGLILGD